MWDCDPNATEEQIELFNKLIAGMDKKLSFFERVTNGIVYFYRLFVTPKEYINMILHGELVSPIIRDSGYEEDFKILE